MRTIISLLLLWAAASSALAQFNPVQLSVQPLSSKRERGDYGDNAANYYHSRGLRITLRNTSPQPVDGLTLRWAIIREGGSRFSSGGLGRTAFGAEETTELKPLEQKVIETSRLSVSGFRGYSNSSYGGKIIGHGVQLLRNGKLIAEEIVPPTCKQLLEKITPMPKEGEEK